MHRTNRSSSGDHVIRALGHSVVVLGVEDHDFTARVTDLLSESTNVDDVPLATLKFERVGGQCFLKDQRWSIGPAESVAALAERFVAWLTFALLERDAERLHLHAALVSHEGGGLLICGPKGAGKSTLAAALVSRGAAYLTDEMVALDPVSRVVPAYHKPFTLKGWARGHFAGEHGEAPAVVAASALGPLGQSCQPRTIVFPEFREGGGFRIEPVSTDRAVSLLMQELLDYDRMPEFGLDIVLDLVDSCETVAVRFGEVRQAARAVEGLTARPRTTGRSVGSVHGLSSLGRRQYRVDTATRRLTAVQLAIEPVPAERLEVEWPAADVGGGVLLYGELLDSADGRVPVGAGAAAEGAMVLRPDELVGADHQVQIGSHVGLDLPLRPLWEASVLLGSQGGGAEVRGLHPRHRLIWWALNMSCHPSADAALGCAVNGRQHRDALNLALEESAWWGVQKAVVDGLYRAASMPPGLPRELRSVLRHLRA